MLTRCDPEYAALETAYQVRPALGDDSLERFLFVRAEPEVDDAIDLGEITELQPHVET